MTEAEWNTCHQPPRLLHFVRLRASPRQLRLIACACCRLVWDPLPGNEARAAVALAEEYADERLAEERRQQAYRHLNKVISQLSGAPARLAQATAELLRPDFSPALVLERARTGSDAYLLPVKQSHLLRDIIGSPFRHLSLDPALRASNNGAVERVAREIYQTSCFEEMPILADALEEAGCVDAAILDHCRNRGSHVRGCWVVDLARGWED